MAYSEARMNGAQNFRAGINVVYSGAQDWNANASRFDWQVWLRRAAGWTSWTNSTCSWSANIGGVGYGGTFTVPQSTSGSDLLVATGSTWHGHDAAGYRGGFASSAYLSVPHSNIGAGGSGDAWVDAPRIPKPPSAPGQPVPSALTSTGVTLSWAGVADNGGAAIDQYLLRRHTVPNVESPGFVDVALGGSTLTHNVGGLIPGTQYYWGVYAHNSRGYSARSGVLGLKTLAALYYGVGGAFVPVELRVGKGGLFVAPDLRIGDDGAFVAAG